MAIAEFTLKKELFMQELVKREWNIERFADQAKLSFVTVYRVLSGDRKPSNKFIAATMLAFNSEDITQFFLINLSPTGEKEKAR